jgi:membrane-bound lytic murein transglycosylase D
MLINTSLKNLLWGHVGAQECFAHRKALLSKEAALRYQKPLKNFIWLVFITIAFFTTTGNVILFAGEDDRPMRGVKPDPSLPFPTRTSTYLFEPAPNSLLTEKALSQPLTQHYIAQYSSPHGVRTLNAIIERANIYMPFIKKEVARRGLPPELAYLPIIESGFQITARSKSGAMGLWQFMLNSISPYNIRVTDLIDERRDSVKSTLGALQKLENEYRQIGCWELALAAYNSGFNAVTRTIKKTGKNDYWELSNKNDLRPETINFVPRLIAVSHVVSNPRKYGLSIWHENFEWTAIPLPRQVSIDLIAEETGISKELLRKLNAELLQGITPADSNYRLKIPASYEEQIKELFDREDLKLIRYYYHTVRKGDTLWSMSQHYGTSVSMIEQHNPGLSSRYLKLGDTVVIPALNNAMPPARKITAGIASGAAGTHIVQKGETLWSLSRKYAVTPEALAEANGMQLNEILREGRAIRVPIIE